MKDKDLVRSPGLLGNNMTYGLVISCTSNDIIKIYGSTMSADVFYRFRYRKNVIHTQINDTVTIFYFRKVWASSKFAYI